jgi:hypothetical protein
LLLLSGRQDLEALPAKQAETRPGSDRLGRLYEGALGCLLDQVAGRAAARRRSNGCRTARRRSWLRHRPLRGRGDHPVVCGDQVRARLDAPCGLAALPGSIERSKNSSGSASGCGARGGLATTTRSFRSAIIPAHGRAGPTQFSGKPFIDVRSGPIPCGPGVRHSAAVTSSRRSHKPT